MFKVMELGLGVSLWDLTDLADSQQKKKKKKGGVGGPGVGSGVEDLLWAKCSIISGQPPLLPLGS